MSAKALARIAFTVLLWGGTAAAQDYPSRPVTLIISTSVGTTADISARIFAPRLQRTFGKPVIVENRTGASGSIAIASVVKAPPDGHMLLLTASTIAINPLLSRDLGWDPVKYLQPVALLAYVTFALLVHPSLPIHSVQELIAFTRQRPGVLNFGSPGTSTPHHLAMEQFKQVTGIKITHIPYTGTSGALNDLVGGRVETAFFPVYLVVKLAAAGKLRMIGSAGDKRTPWTPDLPSFAEQGVPGIDVESWIGVFAPIGTPLEVVSRLSNEFLALVKTPELRDQLFQQGIITQPGGPEDLARMLKSDIDRYRKIIAQANIQRD